MPVVTLSLAAAPADNGAAITGYDWQVAMATDTAYASPLASDSVQAEARSTPINVTVPVWARQRRCPRRLLPICEG